MSSRTTECLRVKSNLFNVAALFFLSFVAYLNAFENRFVWDDELFVVNNSEIRDLGTYPKFFMEGSQNLYRPLRTVLYAATYRFSGLKPAGYHLVGKALNSLTVCSLYALLALLFNNRRGAFWGALLFALHPVHTEKVAYITSSYDILGDFFWLSAFACYVAFRRGRAGTYLAGSLALFLLGLLSSETAAVTPMVIVLYDLTLGKLTTGGGPAWLGGVESAPAGVDPNAGGSRPLRLRPFPFLWGPFFAVLAGYLLLRFSVLGVVSRTGGSLVPSDLAGYFVTTAGVVTQYFRLMLFPWPLVPVHEVGQAVRPYPFALIVSAVGISAAVLAAAFYHRRRPEYAFSFLWFFAVLSPNLNFIPTGTLMAERYIYVPSAVISFFASIAFAKASDNGKKLLASLFFLVACVYFAGTIARNREWREEAVLWTSAIEADPVGSDAAASNLAILLDQRGLAAEAIKLLEAARRAAPDRPLTSAKLGELYMESGRLGEAENIFQRLIDNPLVLYRARYDLAKIRVMQVRYPEAEKLLGEILKVNPYAPDTLNIYASVLFAQGRPNWAGSLVLAYASTGRAYYLENLASFYLLTDKKGPALVTAKIGLLAEPDNKRLKEIVEASLKPKGD